MFNDTYRTHLRARTDLADTLNAVRLAAAAGDRTHTLDADHALMLADEISRLRRQTEAVRRLHYRAYGPDGRFLCAACNTGTDPAAWRDEWPCRTIRELNDAA